jgi:hypothetical protein
MMKAILWGAGLLVLLIFSSYAALQKDRILRYAESHPDTWVARNVPYAVGHIYYSTRRYRAANHYFSFVVTRYPETSRAHECAFYRLQGLRILTHVTPADYEQFLARYPEGQYSEVVRRWRQQAQ